MRPLPLLPLQLVLGGVLQRISRRNPALFDRLGPHARARFGIRPIDLPFAFVVEAKPPRLSVVRELPKGLDARISASLANLLALLEGRVDGDALMFSREARDRGRCRGGAGAAQCDRRRRGSISLPRRPQCSAPWARLRGASSKPPAATWSERRGKASS
ncbi:SCP2 sterol-binding domain-containing protein [Bradyrhizobium guangxiense]